MVSKMESDLTTQDGVPDVDLAVKSQGLASIKAQPGSHHHFSDSEPVQLASFVNARFADEPLLESLLPIDGTDPESFFKAWADGRLLSVLVNAACEGAVKLGPLRRRAKKPLGVSVRHLTIQHFAVLNDALSGCKKIEGLRLGFVGAEDFVQGNRPVILGVGWQLVRLATLNGVNVVDRPILSALFTPEELSRGLGKAGHEDLLLMRWFNHHLEAMESEQTVWTFGTELTDGVAYCTLLNAIDASACPPPDEFDAAGNASNILAAVKKMGIKGVFMTEQSLLAGDRKLNVLFCAQIMEAYPNLLSRERRTEGEGEELRKEKYVPEGGEDDEEEAGSSGSAGGTNPGTPASGGSDKATASTVTSTDITSEIQPMELFGKKSVDLDRGSVLKRLSSLEATQASYLDEDEEEDDDDEGEDDEKDLEDEEEEPTPQCFIFSCFTGS